MNRGENCEPQGRKRDGGREGEGEEEEGKRARERGRAQSHHSLPLPWGGCNTQDEEDPLSDERPRGGLCTCSSQLPDLHDQLQRERM